MKKIFLLFLSLYLGSSAFAQNCPSTGPTSFPIVNQLYIDADYKVCNRNYTIHQSLSFLFPEWIIPADPVEPGPAPSDVDWFIEVDFNDGAGQIPLDATRKLSHQYTSPGTKSISVFRCATINGIPSCLNHAMISFEIITSYASYESPDEILHITTNSTWTPPCPTAYETGSEFLNSSIGKANAYIRYAPGHSKLVKPLILVDGIDFSTKKYRDPAFGAGDEAVVRYGSNGWDVITMGSPESFIDLANGDYSEFQYYPTAFETLQQSGYDIVFVDFERGADYIQKNGILLIEALNQINALKIPDPATGIRHENVVVGASMGGQVARWALAKMETDGTPHCTHTYVSFDSPQKGANVSMSLQAAAWFYDQTDTDTGLWRKLNLPATRQLLVDNFADAYSDERVETQAWADESVYFEPDNDIDYDCLRQEYISEMASFGYPEQTRNIAISCGSQIGIDQGYNSEDQLFKASLFIPEEYGDFQDVPFGYVFRMGLWAPSGNTSLMEVSSVDNNNCDIHTTSNFSAQTIFGAAFPRDDESCFGADIPDKYHSVKVNLTEEYPAYDNAPGCFRSDLFGLKNDLEQELAEQGGSDAIVTVEILEDRNQICFMPTMSALDVDWEMTTENMWKNIFDQQILLNELTPFDDYFAPDNNLKHVEINAGITTWLSNQLSSTAVTISSTLPSALGSSYNFGNPLRDRIPNVTVQSGGYLRVNHHANVGYGNEPFTTQTEFHAETGSCGDITVEDGGSFILGNDGPVNIDRRANVTVSAGSRVHIESGGTLIVFRGSQLIIESGATLEIDAGANIELWWLASTIHIKEGGELILNGDFNFEGGGFFQFSAGNILSFGDGVEGLNLVGNGKDARFIRINDGVLDIGNHFLNLSYGRIEGEGNIYSESGGTVNLFAVDMIGTMQGIELNNPERFTASYTDFHGYDTAVEIYNFNEQNQSNKKLDFFYCFFENCSTGALIRNSSSISFSSCEFAENNHPLWFVDIPYVNLATSEIHHTQGTYYGTRLENVALLRMMGGTIDGYNVGIYAPELFTSSPNKSNIFMNGGATIQNCNQGIYIYKGGVDATGVDYGLVSMKCAKLINNGVGIEGVDVLLDIDACVEGDPTCTAPQSNTFDLGADANDYFKICYLDRDDIETVSATHTIIGVLGHKEVETIRTSL